MSYRRLLIGCAVGALMIATGATALDASKNGFRTRVLTSLCAGVAPQTTEAALAEMRGAGVTVV